MSERSWREYAPLWVGLIIVAGIALIPVLKNSKHRDVLPPPSAFEVVDPASITVPAVEQPEGEATPNENALLGDRLAPGIEALVGGLALLVSTWAVWLVRGTLIEARKATAAAVAANAGFAEASKHELRAYVSMRETRLEKRLDGRIGILSRWENSGQTPTRRAISQFGYELREDDLPSDFTYPDSSSGTPQPQHIGPHQECRTGGLELGIFDQGRLVRREIRLFVWGWFEYSDVFEGSPRRRSEFCVEIFAVQGTIELIARHYGPHNGADAGCWKQPQTS